MTTPQDVGIRYVETIELNGCDEKDPTMLEGKKRQVMRFLGQLPRGRNVAVDCSTVTAFSAGVVEILTAMALLIKTNGGSLGCINVSPEAFQSLRSHPRGNDIRVCPDSTAVAYPEINEDRP